MTSKTNSHMAPTEDLKVPNSCAHYTVYVFLLITSTLAFAVGLAVTYEFLFCDDYLQYYLEKPIFFLLAESTGTIFIAHLGFISLWRRSCRGLRIFVITTAVLVVFTVFSIVFTSLFSIKADEAIYSKLQSDIQNYKPDSESVNKIQSYLRCCGYEDHTDWSKNQTNVIPESCCVNSTCTSESLTSLHKIGCRRALEKFLNLRKIILALILVSLGLNQIFSLILSLIAYRGMIRIRQNVPAVDSDPLEFKRDSFDIAVSKCEKVSSVGNFPQNFVVSPVVNLSTVEKISPVGISDPYVRRPTQYLPVLSYRSTHESFLKQPAQKRFDRRLVLS